MVSLEETDKSVSTTLNVQSFRTFLYSNKPFLGYQQGWGVHGLTFLLVLDFNEHVCGALVNTYSLLMPLLLF